MSRSLNRCVTRLGISRHARSAAEPHLWGRDKINPLFPVPFFLEEHRFALHDLKRRGITDTPGDRKQKQDANGHRYESMLYTYDFSLPLVSPSAE